MSKQILLGHGSGGRLSHKLIQEIFLKHFNNTILNEQGDASILPAHDTQLAFTTDSYVVDPVFFPGGNIGKLAVCGTVNDLAVSFAIPKYLSAGFIIEEGFLLEDLELIVTSMAHEAKNAGVKIVTGDTKVVDKGKCDKLFINTAGIGEIPTQYNSEVYIEKIEPDDIIIINGFIGDHGMAVMAARHSLNIKTEITSDCASLNGLIKSVLDSNCKVKFMRDPTRGGLATVLNEVAEKIGKGILIDETAVPVRENVRGICEILGFDPLYVANEGKVVMIINKNDAEKALQIMKKHPLGKDSAIIGEITKKHKNKCVLKTSIGGHRIIDMLAGEQLPRIC